MQAVGHLMSNQIQGYVRTPLGNFGRASPIIDWPVGPTFQSALELSGMNWFFSTEAFRVLNFLQRASLVIL